MITTEDNNNGVKDEENGPRPATTTKSEGGECIGGYDGMIGGGRPVETH